MKLIECPNCKYEFKQSEFEKAYLEILRKVEQDMAKKGIASLGNPDYIFLKDIMETLEHSINSESPQ